MYACEDKNMSLLLKLFCNEKGWEVILFDIPDKLHQRTVCAKHEMRETPRNKTTISVETDQPKFAWVSFLPFNIQSLSTKSWMQLSQATNHICKNLYRVNFILKRTRIIFCTNKIIIIINLQQSLCPSIGWSP